MMKNKLYIKRYTHGGFGSVPVKQTLYERIRQLFFEKRYLKIVYMRCTTIDKAANMIKNIGYEKVIDAEWFDGHGKSMDIIRKGKVNPRVVKVGYVDKLIHSIR